MSDADAIKADIELTRAELARTVDALHAKLDERLDVKTQARRKLLELQVRATSFAEENRPALLAAAGVLVLMMALRRRRHGKS